MKYIFRVYQFINILSLDVAAGAVICAQFFARLFHVTILLQGLASLGIAVWIIYTMDHLLDAYRLKQEASTVRHRFHQKHFKTLLLLLSIACIIELVLIFFLRRPVFYAGLWLGVGVAIYVLANRWFNYSKEITAALLYSCGVLLPAFSLRSAPLLNDEKLMIAQFVLIALTNLILFSWMDYEKDLKDNHHSLVTHLGKKTVTVILVFLFVVLVALAFTTLSVYQSETLILLMMTGSLFLIFLLPAFFRKNERFRFLGDAVFFIPALILIS